VWDNAKLERVDQTALTLPSYLVVLDIRLTDNCQETKKPSAKGTDRVACVVTLADVYVDLEEQTHGTAKFQVYT
jgi:hypothetical protein